jgi:hypothetical protein
LAVDSPARPLIVRSTSFGALIDVAEYAEMQVGILVKNRALVASDWRCRCAIASPRLLLPIPKGEPRQAYTTQRRGAGGYGPTLCLFRSDVCTLAYSA